ncbi:MAG: hypothetical protein O3C40_32745 [Planctomycetota bacterium]|nr:hypothetical protein [Planctomycetota bacterium]
MNRASTCRRSAVWIMRMLSLSTLRNNVARLKFHLRDATLYSFQIGGELPNK